MHKKIFSNLKRGNNFGDIEADGRIYTEVINLLVSENIKGIMV
jgi:hypothetical protein